MILTISNLYNDKTEFFSVAVVSKKFSFLSLLLISGATQKLISSQPNLYLQLQRFQSLPNFKKFQIPMSHVLDLFPTKNIKNLIGFKLNHKLDFVGLTLYFQSPGETVSLEYHQKGGHTSITSHEIYEKQLVRDSEFMSVVCKSLKVFLKSSLLIKKLDLEISQLDYEELDKRMSASSQSIQFYDWFIQFLNNHRTGGLKPKLISLLGFTGYQALSIFRHISSNHLEIINLNFRKEDTEIEEHFQEIVKMKQWKHAKYLHLEECCTSIENVLHFQGANFKVDVISIDDLQLMKEACF